MRPGQELVASPPIEDTCPVEHEAPAATPSGKTFLLPVWSAPPMSLRSLHFGVAVIHNLIRQLSSLLKRLEVLVWVESELAAIRRAVADVEKSLKELEKGMQAVKVEVCWMREEKEAIEAKCKDAE
ncbi:hypothetical protein PVL29_004833 [Vitis rotundifolia]|uniref:Uncharacterized protein n=1 Tax=Vitis rotundifolia TaxID=103349 RepID=A0AA39A8Z4_VITRO|nr:hypothetical protein PVL29_004833 [Vitis rotundifolia]